MRHSGFAVAFFIFPDYLLNIILSLENNFANTTIPSPINTEFEIIVNTIYNGFKERARIELIHTTAL